MKTIEIHLLHQSSPIKVIDVVNSYQKGDLFCVMYKSSKSELIVDKFPYLHIFRVREYG